MVKDTAATAAVDTAEELPRTIVRRVVKERLSEISGDGGDVILHKEALLAFSESARIFIHYLAATAHDICTESKRQIINADDVLNALEEIEFSEFVEPLQGALEELRKKNSGKRAAAAAAAKTKEADKKQKTDKEVSTESGQDEDKDEEGDENKEDDEDKDIEENGDNDEEQVNEDKDNDDDDDDN